MSRARVVMAALLSLCLSCGGGSPADPVVDSGPSVDAQLEDTGSPGAPDTGPPDAGPVDAFTSDSGADAGPFRPDSYCPGAPGCASAGDMVLHAGAGMQTITATVDENSEIQTIDNDGNGELDLSEGDDFRDVNGDGVYQGVWIAGFGNARGASGVRMDEQGNREEQWARALALRYGDTTLVLVAIDCIGYFKSEMDQVRAMVADLSIDHVAFSSTHVHEARDTLGLWGRTETETGLDPDYQAYVRTQAARAIRDAVGALEPVAQVQYARFDLRDQEFGDGMRDVVRIVSDVRDPVAIDDRVQLIRFARADSSTVATMVNFGAHPEYLDSRNQLLSSDYVHYLRRTIESGVPAGDVYAPEIAGVGGMAIFFQGALGSQIGPGAIRPVRWDGTTLPTRPETAENRGPLTEGVGKQLGYFSLRALAGQAAGGQTDMEPTAALGFRTRAFDVPIQNRGYWVAIINEIFERPARYDMDRLISNNNIPIIETEVTVIDIGLAQIMTVPGELDPTIFVGGYDGSFTPAGAPIIDPGNPNPPDLTLAMTAEPPPLRSIARGDAAYVMLWGLANDNLGYFVPSYDYELDARNPYLDEAPGDHYEETNSVGVDGWPRIDAELRALVAWTP